MMMRLCTGCEQWPAFISGFSFDRRVMRAAWRTACSVAKSLGVELEFGDRAAESVAVHTELASSLALISVAVLQDRKDKFLFEFADGFGVGDTASVHLHHKSFQLIFHDASLFALSYLYGVASYRLPPYVLWPGMCSGTVE